MQNKEEHEGWNDQDYLALLNPIAFSSRFLNRELHPFQKAVIENILREDSVLVLCARQLGKTEVIAILVTWILFAKPNQKILIFAPKYEQAVDNLFARVRDFVKKNKKLMSLIHKEPVTGKVKLGSDFIQVENGSSARALSASKDSNIEGWTADWEFIDESQNIADLAFYKKLVPMVTATGGKIIQIGTPRSRNHFYESYNDKENWKVLEFDYKHGTDTYKEKVMKLKKIMPREDFATEYELKWIDEDALYFNSKDITAAFVDTYDYPLQTGADKYIGIDLAKKKDTTVVTIVANEGGTIRVVHVLECRGSYPVQRKEILEIMDRYQPRKVLLDGTGLGDTFLDFLQAESRVPYQIEGYIMSAKNKSSELYQNLKLLFSSHRIEISEHDEMEEQLRDLRRTYSSNGIEKIHHPPKGHDDYPDSLALACLAARPFEKMSSDPSIIGISHDKSGNVHVRKMSFEKDDAGQKALTIITSGEINEKRKTKKKYM